jgi:predicted ferric reductase
MSVPPVRSILIWAGVAFAATTPIAIAATSPFLAYRDPVYILAGFAGIVAMVLALAQPLLAGGYLPGLPSPRGRRVHRWGGIALVVAVLVHVAGLWLTSPPDVIDALLFASPTPFSIWGVIAMWTLFAAAALAAVRRRIRIPPRVWRMGHATLVTVTVLGGVIHAMLIEGTMGTVSKAVLCILVIGATAKVLFDLRRGARRASSRL